MSQKQRIQLDLTPLQQAELRRVRDMLDAASYSEVFRRALTLYGAILDKSVDGREFGFFKDGQFYEVTIL